MCPSPPRVCSEPGGQKPVLSLSLDCIWDGYFFQTHFMDWCIMCFRQNCPQMNDTWPQLWLVQEMEWTLVDQVPWHYKLSLGASELTHCPLNQNGNMDHSRQWLQEQGKCDSNLKLVIFKFIIKHIDILSISCVIALVWMPQLRPHWWLFNIDSGNGLVPSGNKPLPAPVMTQICVSTWHH